MARNKPRPVPGDSVALNSLPDATRFEVVSVEGVGMMVREPRAAGMTTDYAAQYIDRCQVAQHWPKGK